MNKALKESLKELSRIVVLAVIPILISGLNSTNGTVSVDPNVVLVVALLALLRWLDKFLHETGKEKNNTLIKGITRF